MSRLLLPLKAGAIVFTLLWTAWMTWWSGSFSSANVVVLALCGAAVGYLWYRAMRWQFERMGICCRDARTGRNRFVCQSLWPCFFFFFFFL
ncbi:hypothetical protein ACVWWK_003455 [Bradyrhizobium sp. LB9.1b]